MRTTTIGIDLAKTVFQIHGVDDHGQPVTRKRLDRLKMLEFFVNLPPCLIEMEACGTRDAAATTDYAGNAIFSWSQRTDTGTGASTGKIFRTTAVRYSNAS